MICGGDNLKEALTNYLFHQENLCYVDENTLELIPLNAYNEEAEEWANSPEAYINIDVTKLSLKHESKMDGKKNNKKRKKRKIIKIIKISIDMKIIDFNIYSTIKSNIFM
jgi:hypothetical protein